MPDIVVAGSIVVDMPLWIKRLPHTGETLIAEDSGIFVGGKGLNQAAQAARLGARVLLIGMVGDDALGQFTTREIEKELGSAHGVGLTRTAMTSYAIPVIHPAGQYIMHVRGANAVPSAIFIRSTVPLWDQAQVLLVQGELTDDATFAAMATMRARGGTVILDPAPAEEITPALLKTADILTPNEVEFAQLLGQDQIPQHEWTQGAQALLGRFPNLQYLVATLGANGALVANRSGLVTHLPAPNIAVVDSTAAGDAFNGALAWALVQGHSVLEGARLGVRVGSLVASRRGALPALARPEDLM